LLQIVNSTGELSQLQQSVNNNINSLLISGKLDETVAALSSAINLLNARLGTAVQTQPEPHMRVYRGPEREAA
jgi:hypothetical protein